MLLLQSSYSPYTLPPIKIGGYSYATPIGGDGFDGCSGIGEKNSIL